MLKKMEPSISKRTVTNQSVNKTVPKGVICMKSNQNSMEAYSVHNKMMRAKKQIYAHLSKKEIEKINKHEESEDSDSEPILQTKFRTTNMGRMVKKDHSTDMVSSNSSQKKGRRMIKQHSKRQSNKG